MIKYMPHIVLDTQINLFNFSKTFIPVFQKSPLIKISTIYVERSGSVAILPTIIIDDKHQEYFIQIMTSDKKTTIRLLPQTDPKKKQMLLNCLWQKSMFKQKLLILIYRYQNQTCLVMLKFVN